jgi:hypothetical protein
MATQNVNFPVRGTMSGVAQAGVGKFPNPFCDIASEYIPSDLDEIFDWCSYLYLSFGAYRSASRRVVRYFITEIAVEGQSQDEQDRFEELLLEKVGIVNALSEIGDDFMTYGNVFISLFLPFDRFLVCRECHAAVKAGLVDYRYDHRAASFSGKCVACGHDGLFIADDRRSPDTSRVRVIRWNPKRIRLRVHPVSGRTNYYLSLDAEFIRNIREGRKFYIDDTPRSMLKAVAAVKDNSEALYMFSDDQIYHFKENTLSGIPVVGWGIPSILPNFKLAYYIQLLRRMDEAIALDYIIPFRVVYPKTGGSGAGDPIVNINMQAFGQKMQEMVTAKRSNMTDLQAVPFPIGYEMLGGEAQALSPKESIAYAMDELLNAIGYPADLYRGSLQLNVFPVALRLFEKTWGSLVTGFNDVTQWITRRLCSHFMYGDMTARMLSVTLADDIERKALALQAAAGMDISKATAYKPFDIDYLEEQKSVIEEQELIQRLQTEAMERAQAMQTGLGGSPEGGPEGGPVQPGATPGDVYEQGKALAQQLLTQTPDSMRRGELIKIKHTNPTLHAIVTQEMDNMRQEMARQGQAMIMEQTKMASCGDLLSLKALVADQLCSYSRADLRFIASDVGRVKGAREAFHFVYKSALAGLGV